MVFSLLWAARPLGRSFVLRFFCLPFGFLFVYFLCMSWNLCSWVPFLIYLLFTNQKKKKKTFLPNEPSNTLDSSRPFDFLVSVRILDLFYRQFI